MDPVLRLPISIPRHDKLATSTPIQIPCWDFFFHEETIEVIEAKGAIVGSETIWNEVQVARIAGRVHGRISHSLSEELFDDSDVIRVTFSALTAMTHETRSACFGVPAEDQNC